MGLIPRHGPKVLIDIRGSYIGTGLPLVGPVALVGKYIFPKDFPCALLQKNDRFPALIQDLIGRMVGGLLEGIDDEIPGLVSTGQEDPPISITAQAADSVTFSLKGRPDGFTGLIVISEETCDKCVIFPGILIIFISIAGSHANAFRLRTYGKSPIAAYPGAYTASVIPHRCLSGRSRIHIQTGKNFS